MKQPRSKTSSTQIAVLLIAISAPACGGPLQDYEAETLPKYIAAVGLDHKELKVDFETAILGCEDKNVTLAVSGTWRPGEYDGTFDINRRVKFLPGGDCEETASALLARTILADYFKQRSEEEDNDDSSSLDLAGLFKLLGAFGFGL